MRPRFVWGLVAASIAAPACGMSAETRRDYDTLRASASGSRAPEPVDTEAVLAREARLETLLAVARAKNPDVGEARERVRARLERVPAAAALPDLELKYEQWGVPLARPYALDEADTLMIGLRQTFPAPGLRDAQARVALEEAHAAEASVDRASLDVAAKVRRAYFAYYQADREYQIHLEHAALAERFVEVTRASYQVGRATQADVLRATVELTRLHNDIAGIVQARRSSVALLNALMDRPADAPLGPPAEVAPRDAAVDEAALDRLALEHRPELAAARFAHKRGEAQLDAARRTARWPELMVGLDYWYLPTASEHHAYGAMVAINLPWLSARHDHEIAEAQHEAAAEQRAYDSVRSTVRYEIRDAAAHYTAARTSYTLIDTELLPQARQSYEAAQVAFATGQGSALAVLDALRTYLDVRLERLRALAGMEASWADVERAAGAEPTERTDHE
jgi:outer membrane protein TolC